MPTTLYGIKNCDSVKKAQAFLKEKGHVFQFHDYRVDGLEKSQLQHWVAALGWQAMLNTRGTTWRKLTEEEKAGMDENKALALMLAQPALIKRPLLAHENGTLHLGFSPDQYSVILK